MLDPLKAPLSGIQLIDASAGTGKTYTISALITRLIIEKNLGIGKILVVTFTEAATKDLKGRIRQALMNCLYGLEGKAIPPDDRFINDLARAVPDRAQAAFLLKNAISGFDEAAIYTIHGFCQRMLQEFALESGCPFDAELATDTSDLCMEIVEDFLRKKTYAETPLFSDFVKKELAPGPLYNLWQQYLRRSIHVLPGKREYSDLADLRKKTEKAYEQAFDMVKGAWKRSRTEVERVLLGHEGLNRNMYRRPSVGKWIAEMDRIFGDEGQSCLELFDKFEKFTSDVLARATKKGYTPPDHPFFATCQSLLDKKTALTGIFEQNLMLLKHEFSAYMRAEYPKRKAQRQLIDFDDLLTMLYQGLRGARGDEMARKIRERFPAALIDEFQDTDPVQYKIFKRIYGKCAGLNHHDHLLYLIGDPKQSIYQFRGADIFSYAQAARDVDQRNSLDTNYRSEPGMVEAVNTLFSPRNPFLFPWIAYAPVKSAGKAPVLHIKGLSQDDPLTIWILDGETKPITKKKAEQQILPAITAEIIRLLDLAARHEAVFRGSEDRVLGPGDIAVLTRTNREARQVRNSLAMAGVPCVIQSSEDVFASDEALEILRILQAVLNPGTPELVKAALATRLFGQDASSLWRLSHDDLAWGRIMSRLAWYNQLWNEFGVMAMFRKLIDHEGARARLLSHPMGERRITNCLHILEILHRKELSSHGGPAGLLNTLCEKILLARQGGQSPEEHEVRLESDGDKVQIVTIHKSKGLEYPVVFVPFMLGNTRSNNTKPIIFHAGEDPDTLTVALDADAIERHRAMAEREEKAENLRILYVAVTRAINRCYVAWGPEKDTETSALAYLFRDYFQPKGEAAGKATMPCSSEGLIKCLVPLEKASGGRIRIRPVPADERVPVLEKTHKEIRLTKRRFTKRIDQGWRLTSFSAITRPRDDNSTVKPLSAVGTDTWAEEPGITGKDASMGTDSGESPAGTYSILDFPRGARAGIFLHDVMEHVDFELVGRDQVADEVMGLVDQKLKEHGFDHIWLEPVTDMLKRVLNTDLGPGPAPLCLSGIPLSRRLSELEFYYPLDRPDLDGLAHLLASRGLAGQEGFPWAGRQDLKLTGGFMRGFIDLLFEHGGRYFIIDWKSDFLGPGEDDYALSELQTRMVSESYVLQYYIYTLAVHRYLSSRLPGYDYQHHFGGVYYVFLRGVKRGRHGLLHGIFHDRPPLEAIEAMERLLFKD